MNILITDGNKRSALAFVRAVGAEHVPVVVGEETTTSLAGSSRYCAGTVCYPSPVLHSEAFISYLRRSMIAEKCSILIPMTDLTVQLVAVASNAFPSCIRVIAPTETQIDIVQDKAATLELASRFGLDSPETYMLRSIDVLEQVARWLNYPAVIKPRYSRFHHDGVWNFGTVEYAASPAELVSRYNKINASIPSPLIQERIEGEGRGVFLLVWNGELKAAFCHRRLREKPPSGGVSVYSESVALDTVLVEKSYLMLRSIGWNGPAMVEFKIDRRDGRPKVMEVNGRFWGSLQLATDAGINFPLMLCRLAMGENPVPQFDYKVGVRNRWLLGDWSQLLQRTFAKTQAQRPFHNWRTMVKAWLDFSQFYDKNLFYDDLRPGDLKPFLFECGQHARKYLPGFRLKTRTMQDPDLNNGDVATGTPEMGEQVCTQQHYMSSRQ